jgi:hypothetical protein
MAHGAAGAAGAELFTEDPRLPEQWPRVIDATGVDGDLVPAVQRVQPATGFDPGRFAPGFIEWSPSAARKESTCAPAGQTRE